MQYMNLTPYLVRYGDFGQVARWSLQPGDPIAPAGASVLKPNRLSLE